MLPQIHLNFGPTALDRFYQFCLPLLPGSVFLGGFLLARPDLTPRFQRSFELGPHSGLILFALGAYVVGLILFGSSALLTGTVSGIVQGIAFRSWAPVRGSYLLSQCTNWRQVAAKFLGDLAPVLPENPPPASLMEKISQGMKEVGDRLKHDELWEEWYRILQDYLLRDVPLISNDAMFMWIGLEATGWAGVALCFVTPYARHWPLYGLAAIFILFGASVPFLVILGYVGSERLSYWDFTARLLVEVRKAEQSTGEASQQHPTDEASLGKRVLNALFGRTKSD